MKTNIIFNERDQLPKYLKVVNAIIHDIEFGNLSAGDRLPSLNEACAEWYISKDSIKKAYGTLHERGFVTSITRKGFFVVGTPRCHALRVLIVAGHLTEAVKELHDTIAMGLNSEVILDVCSYNYQRQLLCQLLEKHLGDYHYFIMMPHMIGQDSATLQALRKIPSDQLILIGNDWPEDLQHGYHLRFGNEEAVYQTLISHLGIFRQYNRLNLVLSEQDCFDIDSIRAFRRFCITHAFNFQIIDDLQEKDIKIGDSYFVTHSRHLVHLLRACQSSGWELGRQVGVVSLVENDYTRLLAESVSVIGPPSAELGKKIAQIIHNQKGNARSASSLIPTQSKFSISC